MGKAAIAVISLILVVGVVIGVVATVTRNNGHGAAAQASGISTGMKAVDTICAPTDYKEACLSALSPIAQKDGNVGLKDLFQASFDAAKNEVTKAFNKSMSLSANLTSKYDQLSMENCNELLETATEEFERSITKIINSNFQNLGNIGADLNTWLSAVVSYRSACLDDIENPELKKAMSDGLILTDELTTNALAIVEEISKILNSLNINLPIDLTQPNSRKLLSTDKDGYPGWFSASDRKLLASNAQARPNAVVAKDGSGQFKTINAALAAYPKNLKGRYVIYVKAGIYDEIVIVTSKMINVYMYGDGPRKTIVTGNNNFKLKGIPTGKSATFSALGNGFIARSMTFRNTAGPEGHQAVALRVQGDMSAFFNCKMDGYQDTLYYQSKRQFYRNCVISGTIDFIFGHGAAVIQNSKIIVRMPMMNQLNTITADGREKANEHTGLVLQNCQIVPEKKLVPNKGKIASYLGRPWKALARTMVMESDIGDFMRPEGWIEWNATHPNTKNIEYREFANRGPGGNVGRRVRWPGYAVVTDRKAAEKWTVGTFLETPVEKWVGQTGVPVDYGFTH